MDRLILSPKTAQPKTEIYFGLDQLTKICQSRRGVIIADERIAHTHGAVIQKALGFELIAIAAKKTRETKQALEDELIKRKFDRESLLIGMGGGSLTDLVAFTASTYMRGAPLILIPTTLLGMVDAAIGGKTGVDTPLGKNLIGTFYLPKAIFIDPDLLKTLPDIELKNGLSEILKYGLILDPAIWEKAARWKEHLPSLIRASIALKCKVVEADFEEKTGYRRILNFGHTVGHALELLSHYQMPHGEAVALGCMAESYLSHILGYLPKEALGEILQLYQNLGYAFKRVEPKSLQDAMNRDKKGQVGMARFVLIDRIGHAMPFNGEYCLAAPQKMIEQMIEWMHHA